MAGDINFCKNCGCQRRPRDPNLSGRAFGAAGATVIGAIGLLAVYPIMRELLVLNVNSTALVFIMVSYLAAVVIMFGTILRYMKPSGEYYPRPDETVEYRPPASFRGANTAQLNEPRDMPISVTEHTTRTLEEVPLKRN